MPGTMPGQIAKGYILKRIEETVNDTTPTGGRRTFLDRLKARNADGRPVETLLQILGDSTLFKLRRRDLRHLEIDWFNDVQVDGDRRSFWPDHQPMEPLVRQGLILAIEAADAADNGPLPLAFYWICTGNVCELTTCVSAHQATTLILTPRPLMSDRLPEMYDDSTELETIFTARPTRRGPGEQEVKLPQDFIEFVQPKAEPLDP